MIRVNLEIVVKIPSRSIGNARRREGLTAAKFHLTSGRLIAKINGRCFSTKFLPLF